MAQISSYLNTKSHIKAAITFPIQCQWQLLLFRRATSADYYWFAVDNVKNMREFNDFLQPLPLPHVSSDIRNWFGVFALEHVLTCDWNFQPTSTSSSSTQTDKNARNLFMNFFLLLVFLRCFPRLFSRAQKHLPLGQQVAVNRLDFWSNFSCFSTRLI